MSSTAIAAHATDRMVCLPGRHILAAHAGFQATGITTVCQCGMMWIPGTHTTWLEKWKRDPVTREIIGYDRYLSQWGRCECHPDGLAWPLVGHKLSIPHTCAGEKHRRFVTVSRVEETPDGVRIHGVTCEGEPFETPDKPHGVPPWRS